MTILQWSLLDINIIASIICDETCPHHMLELIEINRTFICGIDFLEDF